MSKKIDQIEIQWSEAEEMIKQEKIIKEKRAQRYQKRVTDAKSDFYERSVNSDNIFRDFEEVISDYNIDSDDLFYALI